MIARRFSARFLALNTLAVGALCATPALAHINLTEPAPRSTGDEQKVNPCGGVERTEPTEFEAGSTITVKWNDGISHPGWYVISFDPTGDDFDGDGDGTGDFPGQSTDTAGMYSNGDGSLVLADEIDLVEYDGNRTPGDHSVEVTLPSEPCEECTLQLIQVMDDAGHAPSAQRPSGHIYFRCADIKLVGGAAPPDDGEGTGGMGNASDAGPMASMAPEGMGAAPPIASAPGEMPEPAESTPEPPPTMTMQPDPVQPDPTTTTDPIVPPMMPTATTTPTTPPAATPSMIATSAPTPAATTAAPTTSTPATTDAADDGGDEGGCSVQPAPTSRRGLTAFALLVLGFALAARQAGARKRA